ncbi:MAG: HD domain-containing phosphohydrolase [Vicinamibacterales bacterium]
MNDSPTAHRPSASLARAVDAARPAPGAPGGARALAGPAGRAAAMTAVVAGIGVALIAGLGVTGAWVAAVIAAAAWLACRIDAAVRARLEDERRRGRETAGLHLATIEALALAIDARDRTAPTHIGRVRRYATALARGLGMPDDEVQGVHIAALLHDIGTLAVPDQILGKPGPLTAEEFEKVRAHPQVGAGIVGAVPFPYPVTPLILGHHERWDGKGYPDGLAGEAIPLGARILAVVDYYDALTSDRPYHAAMAPEAALAVINQEAGRALDPTVVAAFVRLLPALAAETAAIEAAAPAPGPRPGEAVLDDIARAHRELHALYEMARTLGTSLGVADTMARIASKLAGLVPVEACALFLADESGESLSCRVATGADAGAVGGMTITSGRALAAWVGRNRRSLVGGGAGAALEAAGLAARGTSFASILVAPLVDGERFFGALAVYHAAPGAYTDDHRRLLDRVSEQASAVIHNAIVFERTEQDSLTDPLTGLPNTRFMVTHLARELARAERLRSEVALLVMDLDGFKDVNDGHGHHVGDRALREVAALLQGAIRPYDICVRYAGDEFIVVLAGCGPDEAERKRLELQRVIDTARFEAAPGACQPLAISAGAAIYPMDGDTYEALLAAADSRMYEDKARRKQLAATDGGQASGPRDVAPAGRRAGLGIVSRRRRPSQANRSKSIAAAGTPAASSSAAASATKARGPHR